MFLASTSSALTAPHALLAEIARHARSPPPPPPPPADLAAAGGALTVRLAALSRLLEEVAATSDEAAARGAASRGALYDRAFTDGTLLPDGIDALCDLLQLEDGDSASFCDLGSGGGDALLGVAARHELRGGVVGVELLASRHERAVEALGLARGAAASGVSLLRTPSVSLLEGDVTDLGALAAAEPALREVTHAYSCCVCFDDFLLRAMARALGDASLFPRFQALVALRELPAQPHLVCVGEARLACSWNGAAPAWVYVPADVCARSGRDAALLARHLCARDDATGEVCCSLPPALDRPAEAVRLPT